MNVLTNPDFGNALKKILIREHAMHNTIPHGKDAAINGVMAMEDGTFFGFADFYEFFSAGSSKVKSITSYVTPLKQ